MKLKTAEVVQLDVPDDRYLYFRFTDTGAVPNSRVVRLDYEKHVTRLAVAVSTPNGWAELYTSHGEIDQRSVLDGAASLIGYTISDFDEVV